MSLYNQSLFLIRTDRLTAAMSLFGENFTRVKEGNLNSYVSPDGSLHKPWITTRTAANSNPSYDPSLPSQALVSHQTSRAEVKERAIAKELEDTANKPSKKSGVPSQELISRTILTLIVARPMKRALARENARGMRLIPGFDHWSKALPEDLQHEDIIKQYPNHLRGELLLEIAATWTPTEISRTCGRPELTANNLVKRIRAAKNKRDGVPRRLGKSTKALEAAHPQESAISSVQPCQIGASDTFTESEASLRFFTEQTELREIIWELDPTRIERNSTGRDSKNPELDRKLLELAVQERQRRINLA